MKDDIRTWLSGRRNLLERRERWHKALNASKDHTERSSDTDCWSSTQSSNGVMTPSTEDWSDVGSTYSSTTETGRRVPIEDLLKLSTVTLEKFMLEANTKNTENDASINSIHGSEDDAIDESLEAVVNSFEGSITLADIAKLVCLWTDRSVGSSIERSQCSKA